MFFKKNDTTIAVLGELDIKSRSIWDDAISRFLKNKAAMGSLCLIFCIALFSVFAPMISPYPYDNIDWGALNKSPTFENYRLFGTDQLGRDLLVRTAIGGRISLMVGIVGAFIAVVFGTSYGAISGYFGGKVDIIMMRTLEIINAFPFMMFVIILVTIFGKNIFLIFVAIGMVTWIDIARIVRGQTLSLKQKEFIEAAIVCGVPPMLIVRKHIVRNVLGIVVVYASLLVPNIILFESFLSFLGLGVQEPMTSWGVLLQNGSQVMEIAAWQLLIPASFLVMTLFCFNFIGDGLRDALDPKDR